MKPRLAPAVSYSSYRGSGIQYGLSEELDMARWRRSVWRTVMFVTLSLVLSAGAGLMGAQRSYSRADSSISDKISAHDTQIAVQEIEIKSLNDSQKNVNTEIHEIHTEITEIHTSISSLQGFIEGLGCLLGLLSVFVIIVNLYRHKP